MKTADINGIRLACDRCGIGEPIVLIRRITTDSFIGRKIVPILNFICKAITIDLLECGDSGMLLNNEHLMEIAGDLRKLEVPTIIRWGEEDVYLSSKISDKLHSQIPIPRLVKIETSGNYFQEDEPEKTTAAIVDFYQSS